MKGDVWTEERLNALGLRTDLVTAGTVMGWGATKTRQLAREGRLPFPVLRVGATYVVPVAGLRRVLGLEEAD